MQKQSVVHINDKVDTRYSDNNFSLEWPKIPTAVQGIPRGTEIQYLYRLVLYV